jgi:hypothetical protein
MVHGQDRAIQQIENGVVVKIFGSVNEAARSVKRSYSSILQSIRRGGKSADYTWEYHFVADPDEFWVKHPILEIECSNFGRIRTDRIFKPCLDDHGYKRTRINGKNYRIHRLIAETFHENPDEKLTVDHIDRNRLNNNFENLRWATHKEQMNNTRRNIIQNKIIY